MKKDSVIEHEVKHGKMLAENDAERIWGWGTPAGKLRAVRRAEMIADGAGLAAGKKVLEIGCGVGNFTEKFAAYGADILAVDLSPDLLTLAKERLQGATNVKILNSPFEECEAEGPFDAIIGSSVLHHLNFDSSLNKIYSLLHPGGRISFAEPNMLNPQVAFQLKFRKFFPQFSPDETAIIRFRFSMLLTNIGYSDIKITPFDWLHPAIPENMIQTVKRIEKIIEITPGLREFSGSVIITARK